MHNISLNHQKYKGPSGWHELDAYGLLQIAICTMPTKHARLRSDFLLVALFKLPGRLYLKLEKFQRAQLHPLVKWVYGENKLQKWILKKITISGSALYGPQDKLTDLTAHEFMYTEAAYERYLKTQETEYLDWLIAALYRPRGFFSISRKRFNPKKLDARAKLVSGLKPYAKSAIALNYAGCRNLIISLHPDIWKKSATDVSKKPNDHSSQAITNWSELILELSGDKFGTYEQTMKTELWVLLKDMNKKAKYAAELAAKFKSK